MYKYFASVFALLYFFHSYLDKKDKQNTCLEMKKKTNEEKPKVTQYITNQVINNLIFYLFLESGACVFECKGTGIHWLDFGCGSQIDHQC
jgi:hypothetical protein